VTYRGTLARSAVADRKTAEGSARSAAQEWRIEMKNVLLLFASVISLVAFVLISVTMINTEDTSMLGWMIATLGISLGSALILRWRYERGKR
jgi:hypothetical protein